MSNTFNRCQERYDNMQHPDYYGEPEPQTCFKCDADFYPADEWQNYCDECLEEMEDE